MISGHRPSSPWKRIFLSAPIHSPPLWSPSRSFTYVLKSLPNVLHTCCQDHVAITVLLTLGTTQQPEHSKQAAEQLTRVHRPAPVRLVTSTGQTGPRSGHPTNTLRVTRELTETNRVTRTSTPGHPPNSCDHSQTTLHRSDRSLATFPKIVQNLPSRPRWKSQAVEQTGMSEIRT